MKRKQEIFSNLLMPTLVKLFLLMSSFKVLLDLFLHLRKRLTEEAFDHLDKDGSKRLEMREVKEMFEGTRHPECLSGEKTAEQCKFEFLNLFKQYRNASNGFKGEASISLQDFTQYHQILSVFFDRDIEFKNFLIGVWNLDLKEVDCTRTKTKPAGS